MVTKIMNIFIPWGLDSLKILRHEHSHKSDLLYAAYCGLSVFTKRNDLVNILHNFTQASVLSEVQKVPYLAFHEDKELCMLISQELTLHITKDYTICPPCPIHHPSF